jgi:hypothetical protein
MFDVCKSHHEHLETDQADQRAIAESQELLRLLDEVLSIAEQKL